MKIFCTREKRIGMCCRLGLPLLLLTGALGQQIQKAAEVRTVDVLREGTDLRLEVTLSAPVSAAVEVATNPDRLVLVVQNTVSEPKQRRMNVNWNGVRWVRFGLHSADPPLTHIVVELSQARPYTLTTEGSVLILRIQLLASQSTGSPPAAINSVFGRLFGRRRNPPPPPEARRTAPQANPTATTAAARNTNTEETTQTPTAASRPSAAHPNKGSLQEGTVNPALGHPGMGTVPPTDAERQSGEQSASPRMPDTAPATPTATTATTASVTAADTRNANAKSDSTAQGQEQQLFQADQASAGSSNLNPSANPSDLPLGGGSSDRTVTSAPPPPSSAIVSPSQPATLATSESKPSSVSPIATPSAIPSVTGAGANPNLRTSFKVKYVTEGAAYLDGGRSSGLAEGMKLVVKDIPDGSGSKPDVATGQVAIAELEITSVAETSAVTDIRLPKRDVKPGDIAFLSSQDQQVLLQNSNLSVSRRYPAIVAFSEGEPLDDEVREFIPHPPGPSVNRMRGRIGVDYIGTVSHGGPLSSTSDLGFVFRADMTRIGGTYWNLSGYWRGRINSRSSAGRPTLQDLINRTYHLNMTYDNPQSRWVAGFGRLYLPWASSLDTIDGGYFGRRFGQVATLGIFAGSTPDPTSWSYNPDRRIGGTFVNFEGGDYDGAHYSSTSGVAVSTVQWKIDRPFVFFENVFSYKRYLSVYHSLQADEPKGNPAVAEPGPGLNRSFLSVRVQPFSRIEFSFNHNYFRDIPTFDSQLIGTGLLDKYLFQGFSGGTRVEVVKHVFVYADVGLSNRSGDTKDSLNQMYGIDVERLPLALRADGHYSRFNNSFADGSYRVFSLSRVFGDNLRLEALVGSQSFTSALSSNDSTRFVTGTVESSLGARYFVEGGFTVDRGRLYNYDQWMFTLGYRFDSKQGSR